MSTEYFKEFDKVPKDVIFVKDNYNKSITRLNILESKYVSLLLSVFLTICLINDYRLLYFIVSLVVAFSIALMGNKFLGYSENLSSTLCTNLKITALQFIVTLIAFLLSKLFIFIICKYSNLIYFIMFITYIVSFFVCNISIIFFKTVIVKYIIK